MEFSKFSSDGTDIRLLINSCIRKLQDGMMLCR